MSRLVCIFVTNKKTKQPLKSCLLCRFQFKETLKKEVSNDSKQTK